MQRMTPKEFKRFTTAWREYENMITRVLPRFAVRGLYDLAEDIDHMLFCRDEIEMIFRKYADDPRLTRYRTKILALDVDLVMMRAELFSRLPLKFYRASRKRNAIRRSHWWWYMDKLGDELAAKANGRAKSNARTPAGSRCVGSLGTNRGCTDSRKRTMRSVRQAGWYLLLGASISALLLIQCRKGGSLDNPDRSPIGRSNGQKRERPRSIEWGPVLGNVLVQSRSL
jgi:hypothetical protein